MSSFVLLLMLSRSVSHEPVITSVQGYTNGYECGMAAGKLRRDMLSIGFDYAETVCVEVK